MRIFNLKVTAIVMLGLLSHVTLQAQSNNSNNFQSAEEQQKIKEMRLLEWYAQEQQALQQAPQDNIQNVSFNEPYQAPPEAVAPPQREDLFDAANAGNIQQISKLLSEGLDVNISNSERETALHMAAARGHFEAVRFLVKNGAWVNARTVKNWIPLHHAVRFRHPNIVNFLINRGSSALARTSDGLSAADMANNNRDYRILGIMGQR